MAADGAVVRSAERVAGEHSEALAAVEALAAYAAAYYRTLVQGGVPEVFAFQLTALWLSQGDQR